MEHSISYLGEINGHKVLFADGKPFLILGLQLNCDSCYNERDIDVLFKNAKKMHCNCVCPLLYWNLIEPEEGKYDFTILDIMLAAAKRYGLRIQLDWFGSYKNGYMSYCPDWILDDPARFQRVVTGSGATIPNCACYNGEVLMKKDAQAVRKVFEHLRDYDTERSVILFQVNNETGIWGDVRCHCPVCEKKFRDGNYVEMYGERAERAFSALSNLAYQEYIAKEAKSVYPLPCYLNTYLSHPYLPSVPGTKFPSGGPERNVLDLFFKNKKYIDFVSPDIYTPSYLEFSRVCSEYKSENNPLFIPECATGVVSRSWKNVVYAIGNYAAIGYDPWAIDCSYTNDAPRIADEPLCDLVTEKWSNEAYALSASYAMIGDAMGPIAEKMGTPDLAFWLQEEGDCAKSLFFDNGIVANIRFLDPTCGNSRGFIVRLSGDEFIVCGVNSSVSFTDTQSRAIPLSKSVFGRCDGDRFVQTGKHTMGVAEYGRFGVFQRDAGASYCRLALDKTGQEAKHVL